MRIIRLFLSSTFQDFLWERETLRREIIPSVNDALHSEGIIYDVIDLREGVTKGSILEQDTARVCIAEVDEAFRSGSSPAFLFMSGHRRGSVTLPVLIEENVFLRLHAAAKSFGGDSILDDWYRYDGNSLPPSRKLKRRGDDYADPNQWSAVEEQLRNSIHLAAQQIDASLAVTLTKTITELEVERAIELERLAPGRVLGIRRVFDGGIGPSLDSRYRDDSSEEQSSELWARFREVAHDRSTELRCSLDPDETLGESYRRAFSDLLVKRLREIGRQPPKLETLGVIETARSALVASRESVAREIEAPIQRWIHDADSGSIRVLFGSSGCGKTSIAKRSWRQVVNKSGTRRQCVAIFLGDLNSAVDATSFETALLHALTKEGLAEPASSLDEAFAVLHDHELFLLLDGLDQAEWQDASRALAWLPLTFGPGWKVLITCASSEIRDAFADAFGEEIVWELEEMTDADTSSQIMDTLAALGRSVQSSQLNNLIHASSGRPGRAMINVVASAVASLWDDTFVPASVPQNLSGWVQLWIDSQASRGRFDRRLIEVLLSLVNASRDGITERDAFQILRSDTEISAWAEAAFPFGLSEPSLPRTLFSSLVNEMGGLLNVELRGDARVLRFTHAQIREAISTSLTKELITDARRKLVRHFDARLQQHLNSPGQQHEEIAVSEVTFQMLLLGGSELERLEQLYSDPRFVALKTDTTQITDTLQEVRIAEDLDYLNSPLLRGVLSLIKRKHLAFERYTDEDRTAFLQQAFGDAGSATALHRVSQAQEVGSRQNVLRRLLPDPDMPGVVRLAYSVPSYPRVIPDGPNFAVVTRSGDVLVFDIATGLERRRLAGHGRRGGAFRNRSGKLVSYGLDEHLSIASISAARELKRFKAGVGAISAACELHTAQGYVLIAEDRSVIERRDGEGRLTGRIPVASQDVGEAYAFDHGVLKPTMPIRNDSALMGVGDRLAANVFQSYGEGLWSLSDDLVFTIGMGTASLWSFAEGRLLFQIQQVTNQTDIPKHAIPEQNGHILILTNGGSVYHLFPDERRSELVQEGGYTGGVSQITPSSYFAWSQRPSGEIAAMFINAQTGAVNRSLELKLTEQQNHGYFRGAMSNVPRGIIPTAAGLFAWSGYGCDFVDLEQGTIRGVSRYGFKDYCRFAMPVSEQYAALVIGSRPSIVDMHSGETVLDFGAWLPGVTSATLLAPGRALISCEGERSYVWDIHESMRAAQMPEWVETAAALIPDAGGARVLNTSHIVVQHSEVDSTGTEFEVFAIQNGAQKRTARWRSHAFFDQAGSNFSRPSVFERYRIGGLTIDGKLAMTWGQDGRIRLHDADAGELAEFYSFNERGVTSFAFTNTSHQELGLEASEKNEVLLLYTTEDGLWCVLPERALTFKVEVPANAFLAADEAPAPATLYYNSAGTVFLAHGLQILCLDVAALMLGSAKVFNSVALGSVLQQVSNGTLIAVRAVDASHAVLFLEIKPEQGLTESEDQERKPAKLTLVVIDLSNLSAVSWESTEDVVRVTEINEATFLLEYAGGKYAEAQCSPDAVSLRNLQAETPINFVVDSLWCLQLSNNRNERTSTTMELPVTETNPFNIRVDGGSVDTLTLQRDRICALRDGKEVGRWFSPGSYSVLDFSATQGRILVRGESHRLQIVELATKKQAASKDTQNVLEGIPDRARYYMQLGRPDLARNILMGILFSRPDLITLSRASLLMAEIQCRSGLFEQAIGILQDITEDLQQGDEMDENVRMFVQKELNVISLRIGLSRIQSDDEKTRFFDSLIAMVPDFNVVVAILAEALEGCLIVNETGRSLGESVLNEIRRRTPDTIHLESENEKALQFLDTLLARMKNAERTASDEEIDWHAEVPKSLHSLLDEALGGSAEAQLNLGAKYGVGEGVKRNPLRALFWYEKAAAQGSAIAALNISQMYRHGEGVPRDLATAVKYLHLAAELGNTYAKTNLGMMLLQGQGCERDVAAARELFKEAHKDGDDLATINLASILAFGFGLPTNPSQAIELLTPLVRGGNTRAMTVLSMILKANN